MATKKDSLLEIKDGVNLDKIKKELNEYVRKQVEYEVKEVLEKNQKTLLRNKSFVIVRRDIIILLLVSSDANSNKSSISRYTLSST